MKWQSVWFTYWKIDQNGTILWIKTSWNSHLMMIRGTKDLAQSRIALFQLHHMGNTTKVFSRIFLWKMAAEYIHFCWNMLNWTPPFPLLLHLNKWTILEGAPCWLEVCCVHKFVLCPNKISPGLLQADNLNILPPRKWIGSNYWFSSRFIVLALVLTCFPILQAQSAWTSPG